MNLHCVWLHRVHETLGAQAECCQQAQACQPQQDAARRYLAGDVLQKLGGALRSAADLAAKAVEAFTEEVQLLGTPCAPGSQAHCILGAY